MRLYYLRRFVFCSLLEVGFFEDTVLPKKYSVFLFAGSSNAGVAFPNNASSPLRIGISVFSTLTFL